MNTFSSLPKKIQVINKYNILVFFKSPKKSSLKKENFITAIEQLPTNSGVECVPAKDKDDSVAVTNSTKDDNVKSSSICFERKEDSKLAQQEMQSKLECGGVSESKDY